MLKTREEIIEWLDSMFIHNYEVTDELIVNVNGDADISQTALTEIPVQFGKVTGYFTCSYNKLKSLKGCPSYVGSRFSCFYNTRLKSLKYAPLYIGELFVCDDHLKNESEYKLFFLHKKLLDS